MGYIENVTDVCAIETLAKGDRKHSDVPKNVDIRCYILLVYIIDIITCR